MGDVSTPASGAPSSRSGSSQTLTGTTTNAGTRKKARRGADPSGQKRRCVSTACIACRKRKSKCDGAIPSCAACASVYGTECIYDPNSDHRRKGVYREKADSMKARNTTLQVLIEAILNAAEEDVMDIVRKIRNCDSLDSVADEISKQQEAEKEAGKYLVPPDEEYAIQLPLEGERELARTMGELRLENGSIRFIGGTSHLIYLPEPKDDIDDEACAELDSSGEDPITSWTRVTKDLQLITHLINMYFTWHYPYFATLSKQLFLRDFLRGKSRLPRSGPTFCSSLLVNAMLALGCHFTSVPGAFATPGDNKTKGDHFFAEAKRLIVENDEYERPRLVNVQALALMSVREAGCAREAKGWVYSGMSFRMAEDIGLNLDVGELERERMDDYEIDARRVTFWGCYMFDKCWSNYLGRLPQLPKGAYNVRKIDVFPDEDAEMWSPFTDTGFDQSSQQPARTRAIAIQLSSICEISSDLLVFFYHPSSTTRASGKNFELKKLSELHRRLEDWRMQLPKELEPKDGQLPNVILMHMFFHLQYIHLFRPFLKYTPATSPLPPHVSPRRICTANAGAISKLMRLYKKNWNLRQICNIAVYIVHSACTIHLLNLPERMAKRDITHGVKHLEEIAEDWPCARRTLGILSVLARKWACELPEEAAFVLQRADEKYGTFSTSEVPSPRSNITTSPMSDGGAGLKPNGNYSPLLPYNQMQLPRSMQQTNILDETASTMSSTMSASQASQQAAFTVDNSTLNFDSELMAQWPTTASATAMPDYDSTFAPVNTNRMPSNRRGPTSVRQPFSARTGGMDGQEWFLNDSARWQQSFETWDMDTTDSSVFMFNEGRGNVSIGDGDLQSDTNDPLAGFEGLNATLNRGGWLPGLD